ncbi:MAG: hypothetical protein ACRCR4_03445 [Thiotrichaceae bacterium]|jgi:hypothetical protein|uniref:Uncharacterized protein n=1 Tax=Candidatus Thiocaldithrix dubininis TaxID=3080823 RepID=A0AA95H5D7_9GAMM|nr:MAG: hypothetical protein QJT80_00895 [Candidatus Thiocaldithrix dubininis]
MLRLLVILATIGTWLVSSNLWYTGGVLVVGWIFANIIQRILNVLFYVSLIGLGGLYIYAQQTEQSFFWLLLSGLYQLL